MLLLIDKPTGLTSHDAISGVKKTLYTLRDVGELPETSFSSSPKIKIGHAGTLDPLASGLLLAATDQHTKLLHRLTGADKAYEATIDFSRRSDTWDSNFRKLIEDIDPSVYESVPTLEELDALLESLIGTPLLPLTPFSAKKHEGKKLYEYARSGNPLFLTLPMKIYGYQILDYDFPLLRLRLHVGSGTYIRSIAHRLGTQLGGDAILTQLKRTRIDEYSLEDFAHKTIYQGKRDDQEIPFILLAIK